MSAVSCNIGSAGDGVMVRWMMAVRLVEYMGGCGSTRAVTDEVCNGWNALTGGGDQSRVTIRADRGATGGTPRKPCGAAPGVRATTSSNRASISAIVICGDVGESGDDDDVGGVVNSEAHDEASSLSATDSAQGTGEVAASLLTVEVGIDQLMGDVAASRVDDVARIMGDAAVSS